MAAPYSEKKSAGRAGKGGLLRRFTGAAKSVLRSARGHSRQQGVSGLHPVPQPQQPRHSPSDRTASTPRVAATPDVHMDKDAVSCAAQEEDLVSMGFNRSDIRAALRDSGNDAGKAIEVLLHKSTPPAEDRGSASAQREAAEVRCQAPELPEKTRLRESAYAPDPAVRLPSKERCDGKGTHKQACAEGLGSVKPPKPNSSRRRVPSRTEDRLSPRAEDSARTGLAGNPVQAEDSASERTPRQQAKSLRTAADAALNVSSKPPESPPKPAPKSVVLSDARLDVKSKPPEPPPKPAPRSATDSAPRVQAAANASSKSAEAQRSHWTCSACGEENNEQRSSCNNCRKARPLVSQRCTSDGEVAAKVSDPSVSESCTSDGTVKAEVSDPTGVHHSHKGVQGSPPRMRKKKQRLPSAYEAADRAEQVEHSEPWGMSHSEPWGMSNFLRAFVASSVAPSNGSMVSLSQPSTGSISSFSLPEAEDYIHIDEGTSVPRAISRASRPQDESEEGEAVWLNIYDVSGSATQWVNDMVRPLGTGAFHAGVEVYGQEWSFGYNQEGSGVYSSKPRSSGQHKYRESVAMGKTSLSKVETLKLIADIRKSWRGRDYELLERNCCHFSDVLCRGLGVGGIPGWVMHLAGAGRSVVDGIDQAVARAKAGAELAATHAGEFDEKYRISKSVDSFLMKEIEVDEEKIEAAVHDLWAKTVEGFTNVGAFAEGVFTKFRERANEHGSKTRGESAARPTIRLPPSPTRGQLNQHHHLFAMAPRQPERVELPRAAGAPAEEHGTDPSLPAATPVKALKPKSPVSPEGFATSQVQATASVVHEAPEAATAPTDEVPLSARAEPETR